LEFEDPIWLDSVTETDPIAFRSPWKVNATTILNLLPMPLDDGVSYQEVELLPRSSFCVAFWTVLPALAEKTEVALSSDHVVE